MPMPLPTLIRTKREALDLAARLFPDQKTALARAIAQHPDHAFPLFSVEFEAKATLLDVLHWLRKRDTRIYQRPAGHLFYEMATRLVQLIHDNTFQMELDRDRQRWREEWQRDQAAITMTDGSGI